ncbi:MAG: DNA mismatch repair endonuclease MutL [Prevotellaceae bacterium]|jgi:DNA mismatch repair protein MutL|nr:DNA mismatch repair endonuclease MutL [Prevotellaceae bacterium]
MQNIIQLLPDSVANQIAAGEVVQRPSSVVKELVENAIDAGATSVNIIIKGAGRTLVQVVDNGCGMSEVDARLAFERHATSKIRAAADLFNLHSFGFRGEALASIVSVAEVEVKTRTSGDDAGTRLVINGSEVQLQEPVSCPVGTSIAVKNLFYNIPVRRKFLKADSTEFRHIETELRRAALCHPEVMFTLWKDGSKELELPSATLKQRITTLFAGAKNVKGLIDVSTKTQVVSLHGFVAAPENATKEQDKQFLFANGRYFQSGYFRSAVLRAYEQLLPQGVYPSYFIYFEVAPAGIDVNIHPTKTEIKFEDEQVIWQILHAAVRESIGKYTLAPTINFESAGLINIPALRRDTVASAPQVNVDPTYNPFREQGEKAQGPREWQKMYDGLAADHPFFRSENSKDGENSGSGGESKDSVIIESRINSDAEEASAPASPALQGKIFQLKARYILTPVKSGLMVIDQPRAHQRVLYEELLRNIDGGAQPAQQELFPQAVQLSPADYNLLLGISEELLHMGLEVRDFGNHTVVVQAMPAVAQAKPPAELIEELLLTLKSEEKSLQENHRHVLAASMAASMAIRAGKALSEEEMHNLVARLLSCSSPDISPDGKPAMLIIGVEEFDRKFMK